jgi:pullulanase/glycogen debranching enzyme
MLKSFLLEIKDYRRKQGRRYALGHILLFSILAILSGGDSYHKIHLFIVNHYDTLNRIFNLNWKQLPAYTVDSKMILAHQEVEEKTNEIPVAQELMQELGLTMFAYNFILL